MSFLSGYSSAVFHCYAATRVIWVVARVLLMVAWALFRVVLLHVDMWKLIIHPIKGNSTTLLNKTICGHGFVLCSYVVARALLVCYKFFYALFHCYAAIQCFEWLLGCC